MSFARMRISSVDPPRIATSFENSNSSTGRLLFVVSATGVLAAKGRDQTQQAMPIDSMNDIRNQARELNRFPGFAVVLEWELDMVQPRCKVSFLSDVGWLTKRFRQPTSSVESVTW